MRADGLVYRSMVHHPVSRFRSTHDAGSRIHSRYPLDVGDAKCEVTSMTNTETHETYASGYVRPAAIAQLPDWALTEMLNRHQGPALETVRDEAQHRGWKHIGYCANSDGEMRAYYA